MCRRLQETAPSASRAKRWRGQRLRRSLPVDDDACRSPWHSKMAASLSPAALPPACSVANRHARPPAAAFSWRLGQPFQRDVHSASEGQDAFTASAAPACGVYDGRMTEAWLECKTILALIVERGILNGSLGRDGSARPDHFPHGRIAVVGGQCGTGRTRGDGDWRDRVLWLRN